MLKKVIIGIVLIALVIGGLSFIGYVTLPTDGKVSGGFLDENGDKVGAAPLAFMFGESVVEDIWAEIKWNVQGENVDWTTFNVAGSFGVGLKVLNADSIILVEETFDFSGENFVTVNYDTMRKSLATLLDGRPWTDEANPTYWLLYIFGSFDTSVDDVWGTTLFDSWEGQSGDLTLNWITGTFTGSGEVNSGYW